MPSQFRKHQVCRDIYIIPVALLCHTISTKEEALGFLLTRVEVCICVLVHFLVLQNIVRNLGPNSWLNVHPLQGDHGAGGLYCWGEPQPGGMTGKVGFFLPASIVWAPRKCACVQIKSVGFSLVSNSDSIHQ